MDQQKPAAQTQLRPPDYYQTLISQEIGYGYAQEKLSRSLYLLLFTLGCQTGVLGLLLPILSKQWGLSTFHQSMLITTVYVGVTVGSYLQGFSDKYGRYSLVLVAGVLQTIFGLFSCICLNLSSFLFVRFFIGVAVGIIMPVSASYITEIAPSHMRATIFAKSRVCLSGAIVFTNLIAWFLLERKAWRLLLFVICVPGIWALIQHILKGRQSLRYLWVQKKKEQLCQLVNYMCELNQKDAPQKQQIFTWLEYDKSCIRAKEENERNVCQLFNEQYSTLTRRLLVTWFASSFFYYGLTVLSPSLLQRTFKQAGLPSNLKHAFLLGISMIEVVSHSTSSFLMDHPLIGRKNAISYSTAVVFVMGWGMALVGSKSVLLLFVLFGVMKYVVSIGMATLYPYTSELYPTMLRGMALSACSVSGKTAATLMGVVGISSLQWFGGNGLYYIFIMLSALSSYTAFTMPYCTTSRPIS